MFGGPAVFKGALKYDLLSVPEETTPRMYYFSEVVKIVTSRLDAKASSLGIVFSDADTFTRHFELPQIPDADMRPAVSFEAQKYMPFPMRELYFDYRAFPNPETKKQGVVFAAIKKDTVDLWKQAVINAGYALDFVQPEILTFLKLVRLSSAKSAAPDVKIYTGIRRGGALTFVAARGGEVLMSSMARISSPMTVAGEEPKKIETDAITKQMTLLLNYFGKNFRGLKVQDLQILADPACVESNLEAVLKTELGFPAGLLQRAHFFADSPPEISYAELIALEAAKSRVKLPLDFKTEKPVNLVAISAPRKPFFNTTPMDEAQETKELKRMTLLEASILGTLFLVLHLYFLGQIGTLKKSIAQAASQADLATLPAEILNASDLSQANAALAKKASFLSQAYGARVYWTAKLAEVSRAIPKEVTLDVLEVSSRQARSTESAKSLRLEGHFISTGDDLTAVNQFLERLKASPAFTEGIGAIKISKLKKMVDNRSNYTSTLFFIDNDLGEKSQ